jgi:MFS family permease
MVNESPQTESGPMLRAPAATDWYGPDDPENPRNFSLPRRIFSTIAVGTLAFVSTFTASIYSPFQEQIRNEFGVSTEISVLPLALYNLGMAFGPLVGSPLSEAFGRKAVYMVTTPIFALFTLGAGLSQSVVSLTTCRFLAGIFAAPAVSNASATITDYTAGRYRAIALAFYYSIPFMGALSG